MGWSRGTEVLEGIIRDIKPLKIKKDDKIKVYKALINGFEDADCDTVYECLGLDVFFDDAFKQLHPQEFDDYAASLHEEAS